MAKDARRRSRALWGSVSVVLCGGAAVPLGLAFATRHTRGGVVFALCTVVALWLSWSRHPRAVRPGREDRRWAPVLGMTLWWGVLYLGGFQPFLDFFSFLPLVLGAHADEWDSALQKFLSRPPRP